MEYLNIGLDYDKSFWLELIWSWEYRTAVSVNGTRVAQCLSLDQRLCSQLVTLHM